MAMKTRLLIGLMAAPLMFIVMAAPAVAKKKSEVTCADGSTSTAKCKDGTYSHATGHKGACSRHGGVEEWMKK